MVGDIALKGVARFGGGDLPQPCIVVIAYTGHTIFSENDPPTFIVVSKDDSIVMRIPCRSTGKEFEKRRSGRRV